MMTQDDSSTPIREPVALSTPISATADRYPIVEVGRKSYVMMPVDQYRQFRSNRLAWFVLSVGAGLVGVCLSIAAIVAALKPMPIAQAPQPVIVEKPVPINTSCLLWCK